MAKQEDEIPLDKADLELFLFTAETYFRLANDLPVNPELVSRVESLPDPASSFSYSEEDYVGTVTRLMLQRKYFVRGHRSSLRELFDFAKGQYPHCSREIDEMGLFLDKVNQPFRMSFPDGSERNKLWEAVEPILYGCLLHTDRNKADQLSQLSEREWMMVALPYVLGREAALRQFRDFLIREGVRPYCVAELRRTAPVLCWGDTANEKQAVTKSPYWVNLAGHDASDDEIAEIINELRDEDKEVLTVCMGFFAMLRAQVPDTRLLRKSVVWRARRNWGDFTKAIEYASSITDYGFSSKVRYYSNGRMATVRIWPKKLSNIVIDHPQYTEQIEIRAVHTFGKWRIHSMGGTIDDVLLR